MEAFIGKAVGFIWNWPVVGLCLLGCIFFTFRLGFIQLKSFSHAIDLLKGKYDNPNETGQITHFQALSAALSGTIGLGNIAGVAIAIALGGPGAIFWMWVIGFFGMATKFVECTLGTHYREEEKDTGVVHGGPMYYIKNALPKAFKPMAYFYASCVAFASIGVAALFQSNQAAAALHEYYAVPKLATGIILFVLAFSVIIGGIKRIGSVASKIVPLMCVIYIGCALLICVINYHLIPDAFSIIFRDAFTGQAVAGGSFVTVLMAGVRRAIFSNEAGLGSAAIAHAAVKTDYPVREGVVAALGPFIDTVVVCTATALVIIMSGNFGSRMHANDGFLYSFESDTVQATNSWSIVATENTPHNDNAMQTHADGERVLHYQSITNENPGFRMNNLDLNEGLVRFAYFKEQGDMAINVFEGANLLGTLYSDGRSTNPSLSLSDFDNDNEWRSALLSVQDVTGPVSIEFRPMGNSVSVFIDAIESVRKSQGIALTTRAFDQFFSGFGSIFITFAVFFFAFSTIITWAYYGETAVYFVLGEKAIVAFKLIFVSFIVVGAVQSLDIVINISDALVGLLVIPNMIALIILSPKVLTWTKDYFKKLHAGEMKTYK